MLSQVHAWSDASGDQPGKAGSLLAVRATCTAWGWGLKAVGLIHINMNTQRPYQNECNSFFPEVVMKSVSLLLSCLLLVCSASALADAVTDFDAQYNAIYANYRKALFMTNTGKQTESADLLTGLGKSWTSLVDSHAEVPPPQFAGDDHWGSTLASVEDTLKVASEQVRQGQLPQAHLTLEDVRDQLSALHLRNDVETNSDRMNAYHAEMEHLLELDLSAMDDSLKSEILERSAVLSYLAGDIIARPPAGVSESGEYTSLIASFRLSVDKLLQAARSGDATAIRDSVSGLKAPYSKLFLKFG